MAAFQFRLGRLSKVRSIHEEEARGLWSAAEAVARNHREVADFHADEIRRARAHLAELHGRANVPVERVLAVETTIAAIRVKHQRAEERAKTSRFQADQQQAAWQERKNELRALERMEEKQRAAFDLEVRKREALQMDEIATERAARKARTSSPNDEDAS